jgi:trigger factor
MTLVQVEDISEVKKKVILEVPEEQVAEVIDAQYRDLKKTVQIKGFRKGKAPMDVIRSYFKGQVQADSARKIIEETFQPALDEKNIKPVSVIRIDPEDLAVGKPFKYTAEIEIAPSIEVKDYKGLNLTRTLREVSDEEVDARLQALRERNARLTPIPEDRGVAEGDHLVLNVKAEADGKSVESLTVTDYHLELGRNFYLPDFDVRLYGMKIDETKELNFDLPDNFPRKELAGKSATFTVTVTEAKERILPDLDDDFARDLGDFETIEALKQAVKDDFKKLYESDAESEVRNQIVEFLIEKTPFEVPESMVEAEIDRVMRKSLERLAMQGIDPKRLPMPTHEQRERLRPAAVRTVRAYQLLSAIGKQEGVEISDEEVEAEIAKRAEAIGVSADHLKDQLEENNMMDDMREALRQEKTYTLIEEHAEITEEKRATEGESSKIES